MPITSTQVYGPLYSPGLVALKEAKIIFELTSWDADPEENVFVTGPYIADIDDQGDFTVTLFTNTNGVNQTVYNVYVSFIDENKQNDLYNPRIKKFIGTVSLSGSGPFCIADLDFTSENTPGSFDLYTRMKGLVTSFQNMLELQFYDTEYIPADQIALIRAGDYASQNEEIVTQGLQAMHDDLINAVKANETLFDKASALSILCQYNGVYAVNDEIFSDYFADVLFTFGYSQCRFVFEGIGVATFQVKDWKTKARARTGGYETFAGITDPVPAAVFRWVQQTGYPIGPYVRNIRVKGENTLDDPIGFLTVNTNGAYWDNVAAKNLKNFGRFQDSILNGGENNVEVSNCGYQPTQFGRSDGLMTQNAKFSATAGTGTTTITSNWNVFDPEHVGRKFMIRLAGPNDTLWRGEIISRTDANTVVCSGEVTTNVTDAYGSFQSIVGDVTTGSNIVSTDQFPHSANLVGSYIMIVGAGGARADHDILVSRIVSHTETQITLAHNARETATDCPIILASSEFIGLMQDTYDAGLESANNDYQIIGTRSENDQQAGDDAAASVSLVIQGGRNFDYGFGKLHGSSGLYDNNFGGNVAAVIADGCSFLRMPNMQIKWGCYDETLGIVNIIGGSSLVSFLDTSLGNDRPHPDTALFYLNPQSSVNHDLRVMYSGLIDIRSQDTFTEVRYGPNASADMMLRAGPWVRKGTPNVPWSEQGNWTPVLADADTAGNEATAGTSKGFYTRQGNLVTVWGNLVDIDTTGLTGGNTAYITGLPFVIPFAVGGPPCVGSIVTEQVTFDGFVTVRGVSDSNAVQIKNSRSGLNDQNLNVSDLTSGSADIVFTLSYLTDEFDGLQPPS